MTNTMQRAINILQMFSEEELNDFVVQYSEKEKIKHSETAAERIARKRAAADRIAARRPVLSPDFDERQELMNYLEERYNK